MINSPNQTMVSSTPTKIAKIMNKEKRRKKKKRPPHKSKMITGYIIYASEIRKDVIKKYPDRDFGHISKLVGIEWKNLPQDTKVAYEKRAREQNARSKVIAEEAFELKKLADAAEERAKEDSQMNESSASLSQQLPTTCNGFIVNGHSEPIVNNNNTVEQQQLPMIHSAIAQSHVQPNMQSLQHNGYQHQQLSSASKPNNNLMQQQPLQIIQQQQQQQIATTVQYCSNTINNCTPNQLQQHQLYGPSQSPPQAQQIQYQRNNIVYRKPTTVRLRPKDAISQTDPIKWVNNAPKKSLRFSQKFIDYLNSDRLSIV